MSKIQGGELLAQVEKENPKLGLLLRSVIIRGINTLASNVAASPTSEVPAPSSPSAIQVATSGEMAHVSITDNNQLQRGVKYFTEVSTNPQFSQPIVIDHGASRTSHPFPLPTNDSAGTPHNWYFRSYSQYPGSKPSKPVTYGNESPTAVTMSGSTNMTLLPSTGSGTASGNGQQGGYGAGVFVSRGAPAPKRNV